MELPLPTTDKPPNPFTEAVGARVRRAREETGLSQAQLASMAYVHRNTIVNVESGKVELSVSTLVMLALVLRRPLSYFIPLSQLSAAPGTPRSSQESQDVEYLRKFQQEEDRRSLLVQAQALARYEDEAMPELADEPTFDLDDEATLAEEAHPDLPQEMEDQPQDLLSLGIHDREDWKIENPLKLAQILAWIQTYSDIDREPTDQELDDARLSLIQRLATYSPEGDPIVREPTVREIAEEWISQNESNAND